MSDKQSKQLSAKTPEIPDKEFKHKLRALLSVKPSDLPPIKKAPKSKDV